MVGNDVLAERGVTCVGVNGHIANAPSRLQTSGFSSHVGGVTTAIERVEFLVVVAVEREVQECLRIANAFDKRCTSFAEVHIQVHNGNSWHSRRQRRGVLLAQLRHRDRDIVYKTETAWLRSRAVVPRRSNETIRHEWDVSACSSAVTPRAFYSAKHTCTGVNYSADGE